jgi:hypothetical protein
MWPAPNTSDETPRVRSLEVVLRRRAAKREPPTTSSNNRPVNRASASNLLIEMGAILDGRT